MPVVRLTDHDQVAREAHHHPAHHYPAHHHPAHHHRNGAVGDSDALGGSGPLEANGSLDANGALDGVRSARSLREQWAAAGALGQRARASVQVAERPEREPAITAAEPRLGELSFAELLAGALDAYREE
ncbi:MAG: hypothetical protein H0W01_02730 [Pseudonocardiales bacterium]|nr:hypothetical protein [Pseudonocardiales bacterium]